MKKTNFFHKNKTASITAKIHLLISIVLTPPSFCSSFHRNKKIRNHLLINLQVVTVIWAIKNKLKVQVKEKLVLNLKMKMKMKDKFIDNRTIRNDKEKVRVMEA